MVETTTQHYSWVKPEIAHSPSIWGKFLNDDLDSIDALVFANQQGLVPIGAIQMFGGATAPVNWLICDGRSLATTGTYAQLFAAIGYAHGGSGANFNLPDLRGKLPLGVGPSNALGSTGGESTHVLTAAEMPAHNHAVNNPPHTHGVTQSSHTHTMTGYMAEPYVGAPGGGFAQGTGYDAYPNQSSSAQNANITINNATTSISTQNTGGGQAMNNMPPYCGLNFIIRYQ